MQSVLLLFCLLIGLPVFSQTTISGWVTNTDGQPLAYATVFREAAATGTVTDAEGYYTLSARPGELLVVTYTGHEEQLVFVTEEMLSAGAAPVTVLTVGQDLPTVTVYGWSRTEVTGCRFGTRCPTLAIHSPGRRSLSTGEDPVAVAAFPNPFSTGLTVLVPAELGDPATVAVLLTATDGRVLVSHSAGSLSRSGERGLVLDRLHRLVPGGYVITLFGLEGGRHSFPVIRHF